MPKYAITHTEFEAVPWYRNGDHPRVEPAYGGADGDRFCELCAVRFCNHGRLKTRRGVPLVCPGDYVVSGADGADFTLSPEAFEEMTGAFRMVLRQEGTD